LGDLHHPVVLLTSPKIQTKKSRWYL